jgi:alpha-beta hydrolase superfamily lysophospholipase
MRCAVAYRAVVITVLKIVLAGALAWAALLAALYFAQERLIFPATKLPVDHVFRFARQDFEELRIPVPGATLNALLFRQPRPRGLVFFLHGNAGNLETWTTGIDFYRRVNYDLFIVDYRGYGKSTGAIESEDQLHADVRAAWDAIAPRYRDLPIVVYGRSLGTGLAARLARDVHPALLVLVTPYASLASAASRAFPIAPEFLLKYKMRTDALIGDVRSPLLLLHGSRDTLIPHADSESLRALARAPTELIVVEGAGHNDIHTFPAYLDPLAARLGQIGRD